MSAVLERLWALDRLLASKAWPPISDWWRDTLTEFYSSGKPFFVGRVGRRGGKSSTLCRVAVVEALWGEHVIPPGDTGVVPFISTRVDEASERLATIRKILTALGVKYKPSSDSLVAQRADGRDVAWKCFPGTVAGVSGFTGICAICDEVSKWKDRDTGANPATEVIRSLKPTLASMPTAKMFLISSPMGLLDAHAEAYAEGNSEVQMIAMAESWVANPTLTKERTRQLERDEATWRREYAAIPMTETESSFLSAVDVMGSTRKSPLIVPPEPGVSYHAAMDPATRGHAWTFAIAGRRTGGKKAVVHQREWQGTRDSPLRPKDVLRAIAADCKVYGVDYVWTDQMSVDALRDIADGLELTLVELPWTQGRKIEAFEQLRTDMANGEVELPDLPQMHTDLLQVRRRLTRSGITVEIPEVGGRHCDWAPTVAMLMTRHMPDCDYDTAHPIVGEDKLKEERRALLEKELAPPKWRRRHADRNW